MSEEKILDSPPFQREIVPMKDALNSSHPITSFNALDGTLIPLPGPNHCHSIRGGVFKSVSALIKLDHNLQFGGMMNGVKVGAKSMLLPRHLIEDGPVYALLGVFPKYFTFHALIQRWPVNELKKWGTVLMPTEDFDFITPDHTMQQHTDQDCMSGKLLKDASSNDAMLLVFRDMPPEWFREMPIAKLAQEPVKPGSKVVVTGYAGRAPSDKEMVGYYGSQFRLPKLRPYIPSISVLSEMFTPWSRFITHGKVFSSSAPEYPRFKIAADYPAIAGCCGSVLIDESCQVVGFHGRGDFLPCRVCRPKIYCPKHEAAETDFRCKACDEKLNAKGVLPCSIPDEAAEHLPLAYNEAVASTHPAVLELMGPLQSTDKAPEKQQQGAKQTAASAMH